jgi:hypothetical protein
MHGGCDPDRINLEQEYEARACRISVGQIDRYPCTSSVIMRRRATHENSVLNSMRLRRRLLLQRLAVCTDDAERDFIAKNVAECEELIAKREQAEFRVSLRNVYDDPRPSN